jgi:hypothetical protein
LLTGGEATGPTLTKDSSILVMTCTPSCALGDTDYAVYEGTLGDFTSHTPMMCSTDGNSVAAFFPPLDDRYYLVVPQTATREGLYGRNSAGIERPPAVPACLVQEVRGCP